MCVWGGRRATPSTLCAATCCHWAFVSAFCSGYVTACASNFFWVAFICRNHPNPGVLLPSLWLMHSCGWMPCTVPSTAGNQTTWEHWVPLHRVYWIIITLRALEFLLGATVLCVRCIICSPAAEWTSGARMLRAGSAPAARLASVPVASSPKSISCHWWQWCCFEVFKCKGTCNISGAGNAIRVSRAFLMCSQRTSKMKLRAAVLAFTNRWEGTCGHHAAIPGSDAR